MSVRTLTARHLSVVLICVLLLAMPLSATTAPASVRWSYTALGDSLAFGAFAIPGRGYVPTYGGYVAADNGVNVSLTNRGIPGWTSSELLLALRFLPLFRSSVAGSTVVTWNIGGNDMLDARDSYKAGTCGGADNQDCLRSTVINFMSNWDAIMSEILSLRSTSNTIIRTMDIYNPFVNDDKAADTWPGDQGDDFQVLSFYLDQVNAHIAATSTARGIPYARVHRAFNGPSGNIDPASLGYLSLDGYHPNTRGHRVIADELRLLGYAPLQP